MRQDPIKPAVRLDSPLDYKDLWGKLRALMNKVAIDEAKRAATAKEDLRVRQAQGAYDMALRVIALMDGIMDEERNSGAVFDDSDNSGLH